jgi:hypothetical protein
MRNAFVIGLSSLALSLAVAATGASAQDASAPAVKSGPPSVDWPISDLMADTGALGVLKQDLPQLLTYDGLDQIKGMSIRQIAQFPQAQIDDAKLKSIQSDLAALPAPKS